MSLDERTLDQIVNEAVEIHQYGKKNIILDATMFTTIMNCGRLVDFRFNHNFVSINGKSNSLECGSIVHKFLEVYYGTIIQGVKRQDAFGFGMAAAELYIQGCPHCTDFTPSHYTELEHECDERCKRKPECGHKPNDYPGVKNTPKESTTTPMNLTGWRWVLETCEQYHNHYINDHWIPLEVETVKGKVLYEDDEIRVLWKAKLDWTVDTNQGIFPVDHKTMKMNRMATSQNNQFIGQCLVMGTRNVIINKVGFQTSLKPDEKFKRVPYGYSSERLIEWQSEILPYYTKMLLMYAETGHYPPNFTNCEGKYGNCAFEKVCTSDPNMREEVIKQMFMVGPSWDVNNDEE